MASVFDQQLKQGKERFLAALAHSTQASNDEALFIELSKLRRAIPELALGFIQETGPSDLDALNDLQMRLHSALDESLLAVVGKVIEDRTRRLTEQAQRDAVTGIFNRAAFDLRLKDEFERARRYQRPLSLILFDLNHFKSVNDRFGHLAGDQALRQFAHILRSSLRRSDAAFRYGGDEFAAICPETPIEPALILSARIEDALKNFFQTSPSAYSFSISWGVAAFPADAQQIEDLILLADRRLYEDKKKRNSSNL